MQLLFSGAQDSKTMFVIQPFQLDSKQGADNIWVIADCLQIFPVSSLRSPTTAETTTELLRLLLQKHSEITGLLSKMLP